MDFIDAHIHVNIGETTNRFPEYNFDLLKKDLDFTPALYNFTFINPTYLRLLCPVNRTHRVTFRDTSENNVLEVYCTICKKVIYRGPDPYHNANIELLSLAQKRKDIVPFIFLAMSNNTISNEIDFFETNYSKLYCGYKIHPSINRRNPNELYNFNSNRPLIIHSSTGDYANPQNIVNFKKQYNGNISIAHMASFDFNILDDNTLPSDLYFDTSPLLLLRQELMNNDENVYGDFFTEEEVHLILKKYLSKRNVMFATDSPWGNRANEVEYICNFLSDISNPEDLLLNNARRFIAKFHFPV